MRKIGLLILFTVLCFGADLNGRVVKVADGDTITLLTAEKKQIKIRLYGIDAPEKKQAFGEKSRNFLAYRVGGKVVEIKGMGVDKYKRLLAVIYFKGADINAELVKNGYAWAFVKYSNDYIGFENLARRSKTGLWRDKNAIAPWEFRKNKKLNK